MGTFSVWHWLIVLVVVLVLFGGGGKIPRLMKDMGKGINAFKRGLKEDKQDSEDEEDQKVIAKDEPAAARVAEKQKEKTGTDG